MRLRVIVFVSSNRDDWLTIVRMSSSRQMSCVLLPIAASSSPSSSPSALDLAAHLQRAGEWVISLGVDGYRTLLATMSSVLVQSAKESDQGGAKPERTRMLGARVIVSIGCIFLRHHRTRANCCPPLTFPSLLSSLLAQHVLVLLIHRSDPAFAALVRNGLGDVLAAIFRYRWHHEVRRREGLRYSQRRSRCMLVNLLLIATFCLLSLPLYALRV